MLKVSGDLRLALSFDDVLLVPKYSRVKSRDDVNITTKICGYDFKPVIAANMASVCETDMAVRIGSWGGLGIIHRMQSIEDQCKQITQAVGLLRVVGGSADHVGAAVGISEDAQSRAFAAIKVGATIICLDVAHAHQEQAGLITKKFLKELPDGIGLIVGNIATADAATDFLSLVRACRNTSNRLSVKVGIGGGSVCSTRIATGAGIPTLDSVAQVANAIKGISNINVIADGGIKTSGDIVKALAAGADAVMLGGMLAGTAEAPGVVVKHRGKLYKSYSGSASRVAKEKHFGNAEYIEGEDFLVPYKGAVGPILQRIEEGIRSGFTYCGAKNINELHTTAEFVRITPSGYRESLPHGTL